VLIIIIKYRMMKSEKRQRSSDEDEHARKIRKAKDEDEDSEDDIGPAIPNELMASIAATHKHTPIISVPTSIISVPTPASVEFLPLLPNAELYEKSFMHREAVTHLVFTPRTDYLITASCDGIVKWWKKAAAGVEFVKQFNAHEGALTALCASPDGFRVCSVGDDKTVKFYEVSSFDLTDMVTLAFSPSAAIWCFQPGSVRPLLAVAERYGPTIHLLNAERVNATTVKIKLHGAPVVAMTYLTALDACISADSRGIIEIWGLNAEDGYKLPSSAVSFESKMDTDLFELARKKTVPTSVTSSPNGEFFTVSATDGIMRVFRLKSGKLLHSFTFGLGGSEDDRLSEGIDEIDLNRRRAIDIEMRENSLVAIQAFIKPSPSAKEPSTAAASSLAPEYRPPPVSAVFDETSSIVAYSSILGIHLIDVLSGTVLHTLGRVESSERFMSLALFQGVPNVSTQMSLARGLVSSSEPMASSSTSVISRVDPIFAVTSYRRQRFFLFSRRDPIEDVELSSLGSVSRDVQNEPPSKAEIAVTEKIAKEQKRSKLASSAVIHTSKGDITVKLFADSCPLAVENFSELSRRGYYDRTIFHRVIKGFMIQGGDPRGDGTGGESIFGSSFKDEFDSKRKFDRSGLLAMANSGPNTNGSQFFITTAPCDWLNGKHTIFGVVERGLDTLKAIEHSKVDLKHDKPLEDIRILSINADKK